MTDHNSWTYGTMPNWDGNKQYLWITVMIHTFVKHFDDNENDSEHDDDDDGGGDNDDGDDDEI